MTARVATGLAVEPRLIREIDGKAVDQPEPRPLGIETSKTGVGARGHGAGRQQPARHLVFGPRHQ